MSMMADEERDRIDRLLREWRQGDIVRGPDVFFTHVPDLRAVPKTAKPL